MTTYIDSEKFADSAVERIDTEKSGDSNVINEARIERFTEAEQKRIVWRVDRRLVLLLGFMYCVSLMDRTNLVGVTMFVHRHNADTVVGYCSHRWYVVRSPARWQSILDHCACVLHHIRPPATTSHRCAPKGRTKNLLANHYIPLGYHNDVLRLCEDVGPDDPDAIGAWYL